MKSVLNYGSSCWSASHFFPSSCEVAWFTYFCRHFSGLLVQKGLLCERLQFVFCMRASANGLNLHSRVVLSVLPAHCKLPYLRSAPGTCKTTQQMRGLLRVLARISGRKQDACINWVLLMGGRVGQYRTGTDDITVLLCFYSCEFINIPLPIST